MEVQTLNAATVDDLRRALLESPFDVVHFSGHGTDKGLVFEDAGGALMVPPPSALAKLLAARKVKVSLLNSCFSLAVGKITAIGMDYTIASTGSISDPAAIEFTRGFYDALGAGRSVPDAYKEGLLTAELKGLDLDAILLRRGEEYVPSPPAALREEVGVRTRSQGDRRLLGVALDVSGSMQENMNNTTAGVESRYDSVKKALTYLATQVRDEVHSDDSSDAFLVFVIGFGLRIGDEIADLGSLWRAIQELDLEKEIASRTARYTSPGDRGSSSYGDLANLARRHGFGGLVDSVTRAATSSVRDQVLGEIADLVLEQAAQIGDTTLTAEELASLFGETSGSSNATMLERVIFGRTPMVKAAERVRDRFARANSDYDQPVLLVVSDGEPTDGDPRAVFTAVRNSGVDIIACFVTDEDISSARQLVGAPRPTWPESARLMWEIASPMDESSDAAVYLLGHGWSIEPNAKMFVQVNHSDILQEFMRIAGGYSGTHTGGLLPQGR